MPRRRQATLAALALCALAVLLPWPSGTWSAPPGPADAQPRSVKVFRVGVLSFESPLAGLASTGNALSQGLKDLGYVEGQNLSMEYRSAEGRPERLRPVAADLVRSAADVIVATTSQAIGAARQTTTAVPIVMAAIADPVRLGFVESLAAPGTNITGIVGLPAHLAASHLDLLKEAVARTSRVAILINPANPDHAGWRDLVRKADAQSMKLQPVFVRESGELAPAFAAMAREGVDALVVFEDPLFSREGARLAALAVQHGLPTAYGPREYVDTGGLIGYGPNRREMFRQVAGYVDRILRGARPRDLPVQEASKLDLVINLRTARALGLTIRPSVLQRASEVIQ